MERLTGSSAGMAFKCARSALYSRSLVFVFDDDVEFFSFVGSVVFTDVTPTIFPRALVSNSFVASIVVYDYFTAHLQGP